MHEGGFRISFEGGVVGVCRPGGSPLQRQSLVAEGPGIVEQNKALGLQITPDSVASQWDGRGLTQEILADTVAGLLWLEDRYGREVAAATAKLRAAAPPYQDYEADCPDVIVIDDEDDVDFGRAEDLSAIGIAD